MITYGTLLGDNKEEKGSKGKGKEEKGSKGKGKEEKEPETKPKLQGRTDTDSMLKTVKDFEDVWDGRDESDNFQQKHDTDLAKIIRETLLCLVLGMLG
jgi:hypothetical protein